MAVLIVLTIVLCIAVLPEYAFSQLKLRLQLGCLGICCCASKVPAVQNRIQRATSKREGLIERLSDDEAEGAETLSSLLWFVISNARELIAG